MGIDLPLADMSVDDELQAMELLWADLSQNPDQLAAPAWQGAVLRSRREQVLQGKASFQSWDAAIGALRAELHGDAVLDGRRDPC